MPSAQLQYTGIISAVGWTGATTGNLNTSDNSRATGGTVGELIRGDITNAPSDYDIATQIDVVIEWLLTAVPTRAKSILLELRSAGGGVLYASASTPTRTVTTESTDTVTLTISQVPTKTELDAAELWLTVQEGSGMADSVSVSIDYVRVDLTYSIAPVFTATEDFDPLQFQRVMSEIGLTPVFI